MADNKTGTDELAENWRNFKSKAAEGTQDVISAPVKFAQRALKAGQDVTQKAADAVVSKALPEDGAAFQKLKAYAAKK